MKLTRDEKVYVEVGGDFEVKSENSYEFDCAIDEWDEADGITSVDKAVDYLNKWGVSEPSAFPWGGNEMRVWFACETYENPEGGREESTISFGDEWSREDRLAVLRTVFPDMETN